MKKPELGGQAIIEGIMIKSKTNLAIAVRKPNGRIKIKREKITSITERYKLLGLPFIRGIFILFEIMALGIKALNYSAKESLGEEEELGIFSTILTIIFSIALALFLFKFIPLGVAQLFSMLLKVFENRFVFNIIEGVLKATMFVLYVYAISFMKDIKRIFQYHGAEHMTVGCFEARKKLTAENIKKFPTQHVRCGTSFIALVIIISIIVYCFLPTSIHFLYKFLLRILLLPVIAGISYEILKISHKLEKNPVFGIFTKPGLWIQKITTKRPNKRQIEVAKAALEAVLKMEHYKP